MRSPGRRTGTGPGDHRTSCSVRPAAIRSSIRSGAPCRSWPLPTTKRPDARGRRIGASSSSARTRKRGTSAICAGRGSPSTAGIPGPAIACGAASCWSPSEVEEYFGHIVITGSHRESVRAVRKGRADVCAVDCVSHALLGDRAPGELAGTRVLGRSPLQPALPFITGAATTEGELARIREGLFAALADPELSEAARRPASRRSERVDRSGLPAGVRGVAPARTPRRSAFPGHARDGV